MKLGKYIIAILLSSFVGALASPEILTALDMVELQDIVGANQPTVIVEAPKVNVVAQSVSAVTSANSVKTVETVPATTATVSLPAPAAVTMPAHRDYTIEIMGRTLNLAGTDSMDRNAGSAKKAWYYTTSGKFIYAHNYAGVFGGLDNLTSGDVFIVNYGGETHIYKVATSIVYDYDKAAGILTLNGGGNYMKYIKEAKSSKSVAYDMALMTCHGAGDSQRLVVFAKEV